VGFSGPEEINRNPGQVLQLLQSLALDNPGSLSHNLSENNAQGNQHQVATHC